VGLAVLDHLQPVLDRPQRAIGGGERRRLPCPDPPRLGECGDRRERRRSAQRRIAAAVDELVDLDEELDLADAAAAALEVEAGAERLALRVMIADQPADRLDFTDRAEIEAASPDEGMDRIEEIAAERRIAGAEAGADEGGALPGQRRRFVMADRRVHRQRDRGHLRRRAKAKIDAEGIALLGALLEQLRYARGEANRRLPRLLARPARQGRRIVKEDEIDVGRIVEL